MSSKTIMAAVLALGITGWVHAADSAAVGSVCVACHGANGEGNPALGAPRIAGQNADYIARQLSNFKSGKRAYHPDDKTGAGMRTIAVTLSDTDMRTLATHYSTLELKVAPANTPAKSDITTGKVIFDATCSACHGLHAQGYPQLQAPSLQILDSAYMTHQIDSFVKGWRGDTEKSDQPAVWMRSIASHISQPQELESVIQYIGTLSDKAPAH